MDPISRKDALRRSALSRRTRMGSIERADASAAALARLLELPEMSQAETIVTSVSVRSEVTTAGLIEHVLSSPHLRLLLPFVAEDGRLAATWVTSLAELAPGYRGIPEPRARLPVSPAEADAIVLPGVAFDQACNRLGYGGGFFDGFLAASPRPARIGLCFECQIVDEVPVMEHDEPMDIVVTEERVLRRDPPRHPR